MLLKVSQFRERVQRDLDTLVRELQESTGRSSLEEAEAWRSSLPKVSHAFSNPLFQPLDLYFGERGGISLEYRLPASSSWCDMVLLGAHQGKPSAVILELKDWQTRMDQPGPVEGLMERHLGPALHPSDQVRGYAEYCRRFHSAVLASQAAVHGCVLFTKDHQFRTYKLPPNDKLASAFPCFAATDSVLEPDLVHFFQDRLSASDEAFAIRFENGEYRQDRNFVRQMATQILEPGNSPFELLDNQRFGFALCRAELEKAIFRADGSLQKTVVFIDGPPVLGSQCWRQESGRAWSPTQGLKRGISS